MNIQDQIKKYIDSQAEPKRSDMHALHRIILGIMPKCKLWFLDGKDHVRSSYYLEDVATEFHVQGLELDWTCLIWDADFRYTKNGWEYRSFVGDGWNYIRKLERQIYLKNAYRVLLTRARQGMVIVIPNGSDEDPTRMHTYYDPTFDYLKNIGFEVI